MERCPRRWVPVGEVILFGNVTAAVKKHLDGVLGGTKAYANVPNPRPDQFVLLTASGGSDLSIVHDRALLMVDSWGKSAGTASDLAQLARAHLKAIRNQRIGDVLIYSAQPIGGLVYIPDPDSNVPRFRQNFQFTTRGHAIA